MSEIICQECGNDLACEGFPLCSECMETVPVNSETLRRWPWLA